MCQGLGPNKNTMKFRKSTVVLDKLFPLMTAEDLVGALAAQDLFV